MPLPPPGQAKPKPAVYFHCPGCPEELLPMLDERGDSVLDEQGKPRMLPQNLHRWEDGKHGLVLPHDNYEGTHSLCAECAHQAEMEAGHQHGTPGRFRCSDCGEVSPIEGHSDRHVVAGPPPRMLCRGCHPAWKE